MSNENGRCAGCGRDLPWHIANAQQLDHRYKPLFEALQQQSERCGWCGSVDDCEHGPGKPAEQPESGEGGWHLPACKLPDGHKGHCVYDSIRLCSEVYETACTRPTGHERPHGHLSWDIDHPTRHPDALEAIEFIRDFAWRKVCNWQGFNDPTEVQANTDIVQIWQLLDTIAPDGSSDSEKDGRANAIGERVRNGEFEQMKAALKGADDA